MTDNTWNGIEGLTAEQVERLNDSQRRKVMPDAELRGLARSMAADNLLTARRRCWLRLPSLSASRVWKISCDGPGTAAGLRHQRQ